MQVTLDKQYAVAAGVDAAWRVLADIPDLTSCMPGAQITERLDPTHYKGLIRVKVGPAVAAFAGEIEVLAVDPRERTLRMVGKGADKGGSSASMDLTATLAETADGACRLRGQANVIVNGKLAQFGGRMLGAVSDSILGRFAEEFSRHARALEELAPGADRPPGATPAPATGATAVPPPRSINALALLWSLLRGWFAGRFGRHS
jgi:carbon monoxide dehydrogenase subunit G